MNVNGGGSIKQQETYKGMEMSQPEINAVDPVRHISYGWICPVCGRGLSPFTAVCPCKNNKGWEITC